MRNRLTTCFTHYFGQSPETQAERFRLALGHSDWLPWANRTGYLIPAFGLASVGVFTSIYLAYSFLTSVAMTIVAIILRYTPYRDASVAVGVCSWLPTIMLVVLRIWVFWGIECLKDKVEEAQQEWRRMREAVLLEEFRRDNEIGGRTGSEAVYVVVDNAAGAAVEV